MRNLLITFSLLLVALKMNGQSITIDEIINAVKDQKAKSVYFKALKSGMFGNGLKVDKGIDYATQDFDKELTIGVYRATKDDKDSFTWAIEMDSIVANHRIQAIYTVPPKEVIRIKKNLELKKYQKRQSSGTEFWEKDGIILEFSNVVNDIYIYPKLK